ncbi:ABC transporter permease [Bradyrhizobium erythrophlei]|uniref:NitT/TauT family transport system permease protein n=1 Tax=Bradyrhizobium erythrophlei TaxID=1437360 RepID=A0A1M7TQF1_9BRAD|nr:ABC transporter permease [Bradyrhizobium erythrophlei]SHN72971.1 NitT/TauT family transport system permease protein [Bradyrhizobium erythrophlei]
MSEPAASDEMIPLGEPGGGKAIASGSSLSIWLWRIGLVAVLLLIWEFSAGRLYNEFWSSRPSLIGERFLALVAGGEIWRHLGATVSEALLGLLLGAIAGTPIGIALAKYRRAAEIVDPFVMGLYGLPRVALAPMFILWFGISLLAKVMMSFSMVVFVFILNVTEGIRTVDPDMVDLMRTMRAPKSYILRKVTIPSIVPWLLASLRIGVGLSLVGAVVGELIGANRGLGWYVLRAGGQLDTTGVFTGLLVLMLVAMIANQIIFLIERQVLHWRPATK